MNHRLLVAVLAFALAVAAACSDIEEPAQAPAGSGAGATATATASSDVTASPSLDGPTSGPAAYDNERARDHIRVLSVDIGPRVAGSEGERRAVAYIRAQFEASGYVVDVQAFTFTGNRFPLSSVSTGETSLEAYALQGSGTGTAAGPGAYIGLGQEDDLAGLSLEGAVAVAERGIIPFRIKYLNARAAGAVALVLINDEPGALTNGKLDAFGAFPVLGVAMEDGDALRMAARAGLDVTVTAMTGDDGHAFNVLARADEEAACLVLAGGHHDTVPSAPGANDNASGVAHVLELARAFAADGLDEGLCFATFGAEESGLYGSKELVGRLEQEGSVPRFMLNLDVTGIGSEVEAIGTPALTDTAVQLGSGLGIPTRATVLPPNTGSDHTSFERAGSDVVFLSSGGFAAMHSPADGSEAIEPDELNRVGMVAHALLDALYDEVARG